MAGKYVCVGGTIYESISTVFRKALTRFEFEVKV